MCFHTSASRCHSWALPYENLRCKTNGYVLVSGSDLQTTGGQRSITRSRWTKNRREGSKLPCHPSAVHARNQIGLLSTFRSQGPRNCGNLPLPVISSTRPESVPRIRPAPPWQSARINDEQMEVLPTFRSPLGKSSHSIMRAGPRQTRVPMIQSCLQN